MYKEFDVDIAILGAGVAGIGAAYALGKIAVIFEEDDTWGGLCGNFEVNGFRFDKAVHLSFVNEEIVKSIFYKIPYYEHLPESKNYVDGYWVRHPVQNNCCTLPIEERIKIIKSFINRSNDNKTPENYKEWLIYQYGKYFSETYPERYTRKYWANDAEMLSTLWCGNRLYQPTIEEVLRGSFTDKTPNTYYAKKMFYPQKGGYKSFLSNIINKCNILYNKKVISIDTEKKELIFSDNTKYYYNKLISTIPLPILVHIIKNVPENVIEASNELEATQLTLVSIGFNKSIVFPSLWFYVYDEEIPFARAYSPSMKSPDNAPKDKSSLQCEIYSSKNMPIYFSNNELKEKIINTLEKMKIAKKNDIELIDIRQINYGNVIFYKGMENKRKVCLDYIKDKNIISAGRFGEWDYLWSGQAFMSGYNAVKSI